jgi:hypothetical protein
LPCAKPSSYFRAGSSAAIASAGFLRRSRFNACTAGVKNIIDRCSWLGHMEAPERLASANPGPLKVRFVRPPHHYPYSYLVQTALGRLRTTLTERPRPTHLECLRDDQLRGCQRSVAENLPAIGEDQSECCPERRCNQLKLGHPRIHASGRVQSALLTRMRPIPDEEAFRVAGNGHLPS